MQHPPAQRLGHWRLQRGGVSQKPPTGSHAHEGGRRGWGAGKSACGCSPQPRGGDVLELCGPHSGGEGAPSLGSHRAPCPLPGGEGSAVLPARLGTTPSCTPEPQIQLSTPQICSHGMCRKQLDVLSTTARAPASPAAQLPLSDGPSNPGATPNRLQLKSSPQSPTSGEGPGPWIPPPTPCRHPALPPSLPLPTFHSPERCQLKLS